MASVIGSIVVGMSVRTEKFKKGLQNARGTLGKFTDSLMTAKGAIIGLGAVLAGSAILNGIKNVVESQIEAISTTALMAERINANVEALSALQYAASATGVEIDAFRDGLSDLVEKLGDARMGGGDAEEALTALGLSFDELSKKDPTEAFRLIAEEISKLDNQADKLTLADKLFGGVGQQLVPLLDEGAAGIDKMVQRAKELGITFSDIDAKQILESKRAINELNAALEGVYQQLAIQLAPMITAFADQIQQLGKNGVNATDSISTGLEYVLTGLGYVGNFFQIVNLAVLALSEGVTWLIGLITKLSGVVGIAIDDIYRLFTGVDLKLRDWFAEWGNAMWQTTEELKKEFAKEWDAPWASTQIDEFYKNLQKKREEAAKQQQEHLKKNTKQMQRAQEEQKKYSDSLIASLEQQVATLGMTNQQIELYKLNQAEASAADIQRVKNLQAQITAFNESKKAQDELAAAQEKLKDFATSLKESLKTPADKYKEYLQELDKAFKAGLISTDEWYALVQKKQAEMFPKKDATGKDTGTGTSSGGGLSGAIRANSQQARSLLLSSRMAGANPMNKVEKNTKEQLAESKKQTALMEKQVAAKPIIFTYQPS